MTTLLRDTRRIALIAIAYYVLARIGLMAAVAQPVVSSAWPPAGFALGVLLLLGVRNWPGVALGAFALNATSHVPVPAAALMGLGNASSAVVATVLLGRIGFDRGMTRLRDVLALLACGAVLGPMISASVGLGSLMLAGQVLPAAAPALWPVYWSGDAIGVLVFAPLVLAWGARRPAFVAGRAVEGAALAAALVILALALFRSPMVYVYVIFPVACWAAIRFGVRGASGAAAAVTLITIWYTIHQRGPFSSGPALHNLYLMQAFVALLTATTLALAAAVAEREHAERRVGQSERWLRDAQQLARLGSWTWDAARDRLACSDALCHVLGIEPARAPATLTAFVDLAHPDDRAAVREALGAAVRSGRPFRFEQRIVRPDGEVRVVDTAGEPALVAGSRTVALRGICYDVTERKRAEEELKRSEQRFRLFLESVRDYAIVMMDPDGAVSTWNAGAERVLGWRAEDVVGRSHACFYADPDRAAGRPAANLRIAERFGWVEEEGWRVRSTGARFWANVTIAAVRDADGQLLGYAKIVRDLTERRRAEDALRDREQLLEAMFDRTASGIALLDAAGRFVRVNRRFEQLSGYQAGELFGSTLDALTDPADQPQGRELVSDLLASRRESVQSETRLRRKDGSPVWVLGTMAVIPDPDGTPRHVITIMEDISALRQVQEQLQANRQELRALSQMLLSAQEAERARLARELHDQIGQALSAVRMSLEAQLRPQRSERRNSGPLQESMTVVERAIEQVRSLSFDLRPALLDDLGLAAAVAAYCKRQARRGGLALELDADGVTGTVPKDVATACFRIAQEAVANTLRHADATKLGVRLCGDAHTLELLVEDDGIGFDPADRKGTGADFPLGLLGMRERAELVGGTVSVDSALGQGTRVCAHFRFGERTAS